MSKYYSAEEMKAALERAPQFKERLFCRGFFITEDKQNDLDAYPFYSNWNEHVLSVKDRQLFFYVHKDAHLNVYEEDEHIFFLIGHCYDPFNMLYEENAILKRLASALKEGKDAFWNEESNLTGVFCVGYMNEKEFVYSTDCAGMQMVYHGVINRKVYITSHAKLVADLLGLSQPEYVRRLTNNRFWRYWGVWFPGDISSFEELKRLQPNHAAVYDFAASQESMYRYYPTEVVSEVSDDAACMEIIKELGVIMSNTMELITKKWPEKRAALSTTGGRDSMTALACAKKVQDKLSYFSYISNYDESVDAYAARDICAALGLEHNIVSIPDEWDGYKDIDVFKMVMESNSGCAGENNTNDLKKRMYFSEHPPCEIEVKSWVNEMGRGWYYNKYNKKRFPKYPTPSYWRTMHKAYINSLWLIKETDKVFAEYLDKYYSKEVFDKMSWLDLFFWEFSWSGNEGRGLTSEHRVTYDITIPFNNRKYVELMLRIPVEKRKNEYIPNELITYMDKRITDTGIVIKDVSHTNFRAFIVRMYLEIYSKIKFLNEKKWRYK